MTDALISELDAALTADRARYEATIADLRRQLAERAEPNPWCGLCGVVGGVVVRVCEGCFGKGRWR